MIDLIKRRKKTLLDKPTVVQSKAFIFLNLYKLHIKMKTTREDLV